MDLLVLGVIVGVGWAIQTGAIIALNRRVEHIVSRFTEVVQAWVDYAKSLRDERDVLAGKLEEALATNAELIATDAEQDAAEYAALREELTAQLEDALASISGEPEVSEPPAEPEPEPEVEGEVVPEPEPEPVVEEVAPEPEVVPEETR